jgi:hypothetical protein
LKKEGEGGAPPIGCCFKKLLGNEANLIIQISGDLGLDKVAHGVIFKKIRDSKRHQLFRELVAICICNDGLERKKETFNWIWHNITEVSRDSIYRPSNHGGNSKVGHRAVARLGKQKSKREAIHSIVVQEMGSYKGGYQGKTAFWKENWINPTVI